MEEEERRVREANEEREACCLFRGNMFML